MKVIETSCILRAILMIFTKMFYVLVFSVFSCSDEDFNQTDGGDFIDPRDGNTYKIIEIGSQVWFNENLRFAGGIQEVASSQNWASLTRSGGQPAWSYYNNDPTNVDEYGRLYNWYAVKSGTLCPQGWHIPTDDEWTILANRLEEDNTNALNKGFKLHLSRFRSGVDGGFGSNGSYSVWWSSTPLTANSHESFARGFDNNTGRVWSGPRFRADGLACRCLKD